MVFHTTPHRARGFACPKPLASPRTPRRSRNPRWLMKQIGYTQDSHPCSTFEPRHPCLGYANLQQRQRRLRRGNWCNSVRTNLFEVTYMPADIHLIPGTGGTVTFRVRDGEAELTGTYSQRVTGSPVERCTAGDGLHRGRKLGQYNNLGTFSWKL